MPVQQTTTNGVLTRYEQRYRKGAKSKRLYDQLAVPMKDTFEPRGSTVTASMTTDLIPRPDAAVGSMLADFEPQTIDDVTANMTTKWLNDGLKSHQKVNLIQFDNMSAIFAEKVGANMMETVEALPRREATEGQNMFYALSSLTTRVSLIPTTSTHLVDDTVFTTVGVMVEALMSPVLEDGTRIAIMDPWSYADILKNSASKLLTAAQYTEWGKKLMLDNEIGMVNNFRILKSALAKTFWGAGAPNATAYSSTIKVGYAAKAGDKTIESTGAITNLVAGQWLNVGTAQSGDATDDTELTEAVYVTGKSGTTITFIGRGPFGGLKYPHAVGAALSNAWSAHPIVFGAPGSLSKVFSKELGEYGELVKPFQTGNAKQWYNWSWKWWGGYGLLNEADLVRFEHASLRN